jgi:hypothetical protein
MGIGTAINLAKIRMLRGDTLIGMVHWDMERKEVELYGSC